MKYEELYVNFGLLAAWTLSVNITFCELVLVLIGIIVPKTFWFYL